jgi:hypothetical protein
VHSLKVKPRLLQIQVAVATTLLASELLRSLYVADLSVTAVHYMD